MEFDKAIFPPYVPLFKIFVNYSHQLPLNLCGLSKGSNNIVVLLSISRSWKICKYRMEGAGLSKGNNNNSCFAFFFFFLPLFAFFISLESICLQIVCTLHNFWNFTKVPCKGYTFFKSVYCLSYAPITTTSKLNAWQNKVLVNPDSRRRSGVFVLFCGWIWQLGITLSYKLHDFGVVLDLT